MHVRIHYYVHNGALFLANSAFSLALVIHLVRDILECFGLAYLNSMGNPERVAQRKLLVQLPSPIILELKEVDTAKVGGKLDHKHVNINHEDDTNCQAQLNPAQLRWSLLSSSTNPPTHPSGGSKQIYCNTYLL